MNLKLIVITCLASIGLSLMAATTNDVALIYNNTSQVNRDAIHFIEDQFNVQHTGLHLHSFSASATDFKPETYRAILLLNSGLASGIDRAFTSWLTSYPNKSQIILLNIRKNSRNLTVEYVKASDNSQGVDAITAASFWEKKGLFASKNPESLDMHIAWVTQLITIINKL